MQNVLSGKVIASSLQRDRTQKLTRSADCDYRDRMIATLRETKAQLSRMVKLAANGEEVFITVHGKQIAKLVGLPRRAGKLDNQKWLAELAGLRRKYSTGRVGMTAQEIQDEDRAERS